MADQNGQDRVSRVGTGIWVGIGVSVLLWLVGFTAFGHGSLFALAWLSALKYVVAFGFLFSQHWRDIGIGLFISLPIGAIICFSVCASSF
jgi:hypothetical protein